MRRTETGPYGTIGSGNGVKNFRGDALPQKHADERPRPAVQQSAAGRGLKSGEIVSTGTCTGLDPVLPGDRVLADFGDLGTVAICFEQFTE